MSSKTLPLSYLPLEISYDLNQITGRSHPHFSHSFVSVASWRKANITFDLFSTLASSLFASDHHQASCDSRCFLFPSLSFNKNILLQTLVWGRCIPPLILHMFTSTSLPSPGKLSLLIPFLVGVVSANSSKPCAQNDYECLKTMCEQYNGATTDSGTYLYGTNQWGEDGSGSQCMTVR